LKFCVVGGLALLLICGTARADGLFGTQLGAMGGSCEANDEISADQRGAIDKAGMAAASAMLSGDADTIHSMMSKEAKSGTTVAALSEPLKAVKDAGPYQNPAVVRTYLLKTVGSGGETRAVCGPLRGSEWVSLQAKSGMTQAYVVVSAQTRNNDWAVTVWLLSEGDSWRVQYIHIGMSTMVGKTPDDLLALARHERDAGHGFNAALLYIGAKFLTDRGPAFQLGIVQTLQEDAGKLAPPSELTGKPPFAWKLKGTTYQVTAVTILGVDKKIGIVFDLPTDSWNGDAAADKSNHAFLDAFIATHPEYSSAFQFLVARAHKPDHSGGFATVFELGKGYD
jgi:hypothetical protein